MKNLLLMAVIPFPFEVITLMAFAVVALRRRIQIGVSLFMLSLVSCSAQSESVDSITGFCGIRLYQPITTLSESRWGGFNSDRDETVAWWVSYFVKFALEYAQPSETTGGEISIYCQGKGQTFLGQTIRSIRVYWRISAEDFRTPLIEGISVAFEDPAAGAAAYELFRSKYGPPSADGRWHGKSIGSLYAHESGYAEVKSTLRAQVAAAMAKKKAEDARRRAMSMPADGLD